MHFTGHALRLQAAEVCCAALVLSGSAAQAIYLRALNPSAHARFSGFPSATAINPGHIFSGTDLTGIGFRSDLYPPTQCALVTRQHVIFATHNRDKLSGRNVTFLNAAGEAVTRTCVAETIIYRDGVPTDLVLFRLNAPIDADSGISPLPYDDAGLRRAAELGVTGRDHTAWDAIDQVPLVGRATVDKLNVEFGIGAYVGSQEIQTTMYRFTYDAYTTRGSADDCLVAPGDSGSPSFVAVDGEAVLAGVHSYRDAVSVSPDCWNYDTDVAQYVTELDAALAPSGYRMRPLSPSADSLSGSGSFVQSAPRKAMALDFDYVLQNVGMESAGNVEVQLDFHAGEGPCSIAAPEWIIYGSGDRWILRRATLDAGGSSTIRVTWTEAPSVEQLCFTVTYRSDSGNELCCEADLALSDSMADWSIGLVEPGLDQDPDRDGLSNLIEYSFGGCPVTPSCLFADGSPLLPVVNPEAGVQRVVFSHPERSDKLERGLSYTLEFSSDLKTWTTTPPPGFTSTTVPYEPEVPGFVQRRSSWDRGKASVFTRVQLTLSE